MNQYILSLMETEAAIQRAKIIADCRADADGDEHFANLLARTMCKPIFQYYENLAWKLY